MTGDEEQKPNDTAFFANARPNDGLRWVTVRGEIATDPDASLGIADLTLAELSVLGDEGQSAAARRASGTNTNGPSSQHSPIAMTTRSRPNVVSKLFDSTSTSPKLQTRPMPRPGYSTMLTSTPEKPSSSASSSRNHRANLFASAAPSDTSPSPTVPVVISTARTTPSTASPTLPTAVATTPVKARTSTTNTPFKDTTGSVSSTMLDGAVALTTALQETLGRNAELDSLLHKIEHAKLLIRNTPPSPARSAHTHVPAGSNASPIRIRPTHMGRGTAVEAAAIHTAPRMAPAVLTAKELARDGGGNTILAAPAASSAVPERETAGSHLRDSLHKAIEIVELLNTSGVKSDAVDTTITTRRTELIEPRSPYAEAQQRLMKELDGLKDSIDRASVRSRVGEKLKEDSQLLLDEYDKIRENLPKASLSQPASLVKRRTGRRTRHRSPIREETPIPAPLVKLGQPRGIWRTAVIMVQWGMAAALLTYLLLLLLVFALRWQAAVYWQHHEIPT